LNLKTTGFSETSSLSSCTERCAKDSTVAIFETVTAKLLKSCFLGCDVVSWDQQFLAFPGIAVTSLARSLLDPEDEHVTVVQNSEKYRSSDKEPHPR
jgi:hypothetical protein